MINPETLDLSSLPSVALNMKAYLPSRSAIYFVIDSLGVIQYIGQSANIRQRWVNHNRFNQFASIEGIRIAYLSLDCDLLASTENTFIEWFKPLLNRSPVPDNGDKRKQMTIMMSPEVKKRLFHWAVERGCKPCDVLEELVLDGLQDMAIAKSDEVAA
jgi:hypothetical protein